MLQLLVDVHGVLANYVKAFCEYHEIPEVYNSWPKGEYDIFQVTGIEWDQFPIEYLTDLPMMDDIQEVMEIIQQHQVIFSSRTATEAMAQATLAWVKSHFSPANMLACTDLKAQGVPQEILDQCVLVDDCEEEVNAWREHGGRAILLPRPWNSAEGEAAEVLAEQIMFLDCDEDNIYIGDCN